MESGRWMNFFCHSMQRQEDSPPATDCRLGDGPCISTCALLVESDGGGRKTWRYIMEFQSTLSSRRATVRGSMRTLEFTRFQSTLSSRRATVGPKNALQTLVISIHALLTESDLLPPWWLYSGSYFNPRSPCGERPGHRICHTRAQRDFNPRSPCGERPGGAAGSALSGDFNPRSPCGERRETSITSAMKGLNFNPRSPCGERRDIFGRAPRTRSISIHALLAESD